MTNGLSISHVIHGYEEISRIHVSLRKRQPTQVSNYGSRWYSVLDSVNWNFARLPLAPRMIRWELLCEG